MAIRTCIIGPALSGVAIEVMGYTRSDHTLVIFHDMKCRKKTFELMRRKNND